jgi:hypothetical protein
MNASEYALHDATHSEIPRESRIATTIIGDSQRYRDWELRHAKLLVPVAEQKAEKYQILALRKANVQLVHRRAFFNYLQTHPVTGARREQLFRLFHSTLDMNEAILAEHRQYMVAFSSGISTGHITDVMHDDTSTWLTDLYEKTFCRYFEMKCFVASTGENSSTREMVAASLHDVRRQLLRLLRRMETDLPQERRGNFEEQELLARSGRYEALNYLNAY